MRVVWALVLAGCTFRANEALIDAPPVVKHDAAVDKDAPRPDAPAPHPDAPAPDAAIDAAIDAAPNPWPCGTQPASPPSTVTVAPGGASLAMTQISLDGSGQLVVVAASANAQLAFDFQLQDTRCEGDCIDQVEVVWMQGSAGNRSGCVFSGDVSKENGVQEDVPSFQIATPSTPGQYDLRTNIGQNTSCNAGGANNWWDGELPAASTTIVTICVQ